MMMLHSSPWMQTCCLELECSTFQNPQPVSDQERWCILCVRVSLTGMKGSVRTHWWPAYMTLQLSLTGPDENSAPGVTCQQCCVTPAQRRTWVNKVFHLKAWGHTVAGNLQIFQSFILKMYMMGKKTFKIVRCDVNPLPFFAVRGFYRTWTRPTLWWLDFSWDGAATRFDFCSALYITLGVSPSLYLGSLSCSLWTHCENTSTPIQY